MTLNSSKKMTLASVNKYLASKGIKLSTQDKKRIASIFTKSDNCDNKKGELNVLEANKFAILVGSTLPKIKQCVNQFLIDLGLVIKRPQIKFHVERNDATRVDNTKILIAANASKLRKKQKPGTTKNRKLNKTTTSKNSLTNTMNMVRKEAQNKKIKLSNEDLKYWSTHIDNIAKRYNVPAALMVAIVSRETGFTKHVNSSNGAGPMGVTTIAVKDFFPSKDNGWTKIYQNMDGKLLNDILNTRTKDGRKITSPQQLRAECAKNDKLGMQVGLLAFEMNYCKAVAKKIYGKADYNTIPKAIQKIKSGYRLNAKENERCITTALKNYNSVFATYAPAVVDSLKVHGLNFAGLTFIS